MATFIICNENNDVVTLTDIKMFDRTVSMFAIFPNEEDALEVLFAAEDRGLLKNNCVRKVGNHVTAEVA